MTEIYGWIKIEKWITKILFVNWTGKIPSFKSSMSLGYTVFQIFRGMWIFCICQNNKKSHKIVKNNKLSVYDNNKFND